MTSEASVLFGWWWLCIVFSIVLLAAMWPSIFSDSSGSMPTYLAVLISAALVAVGIWASLLYWRADPASAQIMRLTVYVVLGVGLVSVVMFLINVAFGTPEKPAAGPATGFFGPEGSAPILSGILWAFLIALPFTFALLVIFGLMSDGVEDWFNPPPAETLASKMDSSSAAIMAGGAAASMELSGERQVMAEVNEAMTRTAPRAKTTDDMSVEVVGQAQDDLSIEVIGDSAQDHATAEELTALERALSEDMQGTPKKRKDAHDEPLRVDEDLKL
jgi:hypothetical protein